MMEIGDNDISCDSGVQCPVCRRASLRLEGKMFGYKKGTDRFFALGQSYLKCVSCRRAWHLDKPARSNDYPHKFSRHPVSIIWRGITYPFRKLWGILEGLVDG